MLGQSYYTSASGAALVVSLAHALLSSRRISPKKILEYSTSTSTPLDQKRVRERGIVFVLRGLIPGPRDTVSKTGVFYHEANRLVGEKWRTRTDKQRRTSFPCSMSVHALSSLIADTDPGWISWCRQCAVGVSSDVMGFYAVLREIWCHTVVTRYNKSYCSGIAEGGASPREAGSKPHRT